jgi:gliding motility-associated-like protein
MSNTACAKQFAKVYIPNAFVPNGINKIFKPVTVFVDKLDYTMKIFNKWGQLIFETNNPEQGWDGKVNGNLVQVGVYAYYIRIKNANGEYFQKWGTVTLLDEITW